MKTNENLVLVGMSGAGKSTLGVLLAKALGKRFVDTDLLIQEREGRLLQELLDREGIDGFLAIEEDVVSELHAENTVIATGGSVVYSEKAMAHMKAAGKVVFLYVDFEELVSRLSNITTRGIVFKGSADLNSVYEERLPLYEKYADLRIDCTGRGVEESVGEILERLRPMAESEVDFF